MKRATRFRIINNHRSKEITQRDALQYAGNANASKLTVCFRPRPSFRYQLFALPLKKWKPIKKKCNSENHQRACDYCTPESSITRLLQAGHHESHSISHGKKKKRKYEISRCKSVPLCMFKWRKNMLPVSGIINKYHECNCCSTEYIERIISLFDHSG